MTIGEVWTISYLNKPLEFAVYDRETTREEREQIRQRAWARYDVPRYIAHRDLDISCRYVTDAQAAIEELQSFRRWADSSKWPVQ
jgi:putative NIF3 family GTP cyclohydrolase 1 type 2